MDEILQRNVGLQRQKKYNRMLAKRLQADFEQFVLKAVEGHSVIRKLKYDLPLVLILDDALKLTAMENTHEIEQQAAVGRFMSGTYFQLSISDDCASITVAPEHNVYDENNNSLSRSSYWFEEEAEKAPNDADDPQQSFDQWLHTFYTRLTNPLLLTSARFRDGQKVLEAKFNNWDKTHQEWLKNSTKEINNYAE